MFKILLNHNPIKPKKSLMLIFSSHIIEIKGIPLKRIFFIFNGSKTQ